MTKSNRSSGGACMVNRSSNRDFDESFRDSTMNETIGNSIPYGGDSESDSSSEGDEADRQLEQASDTLINNNS